jgi:hypothetical protein
VQRQIADAAQIAGSVADHGNAAVTPEQQVLKFYREWKRAMNASTGCTAQMMCMTVRAAAAVVRQRHDSSSRSSAAAAKGSMLLLALQLLCDEALGIL